MKKNHHYAIVLVGVAIILFFWKIVRHDTKEKPTASSSHIGMQEYQDANLIAANHQAENKLHTPKGIIRYAEIKPGYDMVKSFIGLGLIDTGDQERLSRLRPNPWKVFLDENNHVVKFQIRDVTLATVNNDLAMLNDLERWYKITEIGTNRISMDDKETMKNLYLSIQVHGSFLDNNTEEFSGGINLQEVEIFPVMAQYQGHPNPELRNNDKNLVYLSGKNLPMLLIKSNKGYGKWSEASDEDKKLLNKYGMDDCREVEWQLLPFPRNEEETKFFANAPIPEHIGTGVLRYTPTVAAWERVHGKKYVGP